MKYPWAFMHGTSGQNELVAMWFSTILGFYRVLVLEKNVYSIVYFGLTVFILYVCRNKQENP